MCKQINLKAQDEVAFRGMSCQSKCCQEDVLSEEILAALGAMEDSISSRLTACG